MNMLVLYILAINGISRTVIKSYHSIDALTSQVPLLSHATNSTLQAASRLPIADLHEM